MDNIKKITVINVEEYFDIELSKMTPEQINDTVKSSITVIDNFLKSARVLGYINMEEALSDTPKLIEDFGSIKSYIEQILKNK